MTKSIALMTVAIGSLFMAGCSSIGNAGLGNAVLGGGEKIEWDWKDMLGAAKTPTDYEDQFSRGLYAAVGIGPSRLEPDTSALADWDINDRVEPAGQVTIGADITKYFSIEAHSADLGSAGLSPSGRINYHINGASGLIYAGGNRHRYRRQGLNGYGRLGVGVLDNTAVGDVPYIQNNGTHLLLGAGVEYMTPIGVGLRFEGIAFDKDAKYAQLALMYRTGAKKMIEKPKLAVVPIVKPIVRPVPVIAAAAPPPAPVILPPKIDQCAAMNGVNDAVSFHNDSSALTAVSLLALDELANVFRLCSRVELEVSAHTDSVGSESYNQSLSRRRAESVVNYLSTQGLSRNQLRARAYGEMSPIDTNSTEEGRARNRRVEIYAR